MARKPENPLDRMVPVPADQPVPIIDFFRPPLFTRPALNPAGTHFAAIISTGADRYDLAAFEIETLKCDRMSGGNALDIRKFQWIADKRLLIHVVEDKFYSVGLFTTELGRFNKTQTIQRHSVVEVLGISHSNPNHLIVWIRHNAYEDGADGGVFKVDVRAEKLREPNVMPPTYFQLDARAESVRKLTSVAPWIDPKRMKPMRMVTYQSRDGYELDGCLTLPAGVSKSAPAPLVVLPHGGPAARDTWGWDAEVQFLASRGYAVFQPNYRGSEGTRWRFPAEDNWAYRKMHDDVTDGLRELLKTGLFDADRVAIMGTSFGGYLALCGAAYEPGTYRCAVTVAGVFDWALFTKDARNDRFSPAGYGVLRRHLGDPEKAAEKFEQISPLNAVDQIRIPVFVAHGYEDPIVGANQSQRLIKQLKKHKVPHEVQLERGEGHGFYKLENRVELYAAIEQFFARQLAPRAAPVTPVASTP